MERENDFSQGSIAKNILNLAVPMTLAQLINVLYSVVDRVYIGHLQGVSANALTGIGLALPIITIITAFANLFGMGGAPLCSIARGSHEEEKADPDFRTGYGSTGSSPCNGDLPGLICSLGDEVSDREEGDSSTLQKSNASGVEACKRNHLSGNIGICDVCYKRACADCV